MKLNDFSSPTGQSIGLDIACLAEYGYSRAGTVHIWSNYKGTSLCGRKMEGRLKFGDVKGEVICKACDKSNRQRYAIFDLAHLLLAVSTIVAFVGKVTQQEAQQESHEGNHGKD